MSKKHLVKIQKIFSHPLPSNLDVRKVISAIEHFGVRVEQTKHHSLKLFFEDKEEFLQLPHSDHFTKDEIVKLRHVLEHFGLTPDKLS